MEIRKLRQLHNSFEALHRKYRMRKAIGPYGKLRTRAGMVSDIEDVLHEFAHILAQGAKLPDISSDLPIFSNLSPIYRVSGIVSDALEIDANAIALLAGAKLGVWPNDRLQRVKQVVDINLEHLVGDTKSRILEQMKDPHIIRMAKDLVEWCGYGSGSRRKLCA